MRIIDKPLFSWGLRTPIGFFCQVAVALLVAYFAAMAIVSSDSLTLLVLGALPVAIAVTVLILNDWRRGLYAFVFWILFEDIIRKFMGNNMAIYFVKDVLVVIIYVAFLRARLAGKVEKFNAPFRIALALFFWLGLLQVFNPASPSVFFGLLGMRINFLYVPLLYVGYAFAKSEKDMQRLFSLWSVLILIVAGLGLAQSILGPSFLNPQTLQEDILSSSALYRTTSMGVMSFRPSSVFVSVGRFQNFLILSWIVSLGYAAYLILRGVRKRRMAFFSLATVGAASVMCTSRGVLMWNLGSSLVIIGGLLWGAPWRQREARRVFKAIQRAALLTGLGLLVLMEVFPNELGARVAVYTETLLPNSPHSELMHRTRDYPLQQLGYAFDDPRWPIGNGIGTSGLGLQYLRRFLNVVPAPIGVESGLGNIVVELGIVGLILWLVLGLSIALSAWRVVKGLRGTPWFPLAFSISLFVVMIFFPMTYSGMPYQDFLLNSYLWLLIGVLFRLYQLKLAPKQSQSAASEQPAETLQLSPIVPVIAAHRGG